MNPSLPPITLQHVGARWYDPDIGRFVQRDPIGIAGGLSVYAYVLNRPTIGVDPTGEGFWDGSNPFHEWIARNVWMKVHSQKTLSTMSSGRAAAFVGRGTR